MYVFLIDQHGAGLLNAAAASSAAWVLLCFAWHITLLLCGGCSAIAQWRQSLSSRPFCTSEQLK